MLSCKETLVLFYYYYFVSVLRDGWFFGHNFCSIDSLSLSLVETWAAETQKRTYENIVHNKLDQSIMIHFGHSFFWPMWSTFLLVCGKIKTPHFIVVGINILPPIMNLVLEWGSQSSRSSSP